ncbi:MAG: UPF0182 family protein, partial [Propionibacteriaceae bacterium]|nr:UPF0182 family protein [Propionibacteriaceae bacterium]
FPGSLKPKSEISEDMLAHMRYPEDLFKVQREILARYHMTNPDEWYGQPDLWEVPADPVQQSSTALQPPYYLSIKWPSDDKALFALTAAYVPNGRSNLVSYLAAVAETTSPDYGKLRVLVTPSTNQVDGPGQTFNAMTTDSKVAEGLRPYLNQGSAAATYGNLLTLPVGGGLLYVLPVYTEREGNKGSYPFLTAVVVRFGQEVGFGATLQDALDQVFQGNAGASTNEGEDGDVTPGDNPGTPVDPDNPSPSPSASPSEGPKDTKGLLKEAEDAFVAADQALKNGDLAEYQKQIGIAQKAVEEAKILNP